MVDLLTLSASITSTSMYWEDIWIANHQRQIVVSDMISQTIEWKRFGPWDMKPVGSLAVLSQAVIFINLEGSEKTQRFFTTLYESIY